MSCPLQRELGLGDLKGFFQPIAFYEYYVELCRYVSIMLPMCKCNWILVKIYTNLKLNLLKFFPLKQWNSLILKAYWSTVLNVRNVKFYSALCFVEVFCKLCFTFQVNPGNFSEGVCCLHQPISPSLSVLPAASLELLWHKFLQSILQSLRCTA